MDRLGLLYFSRYVRFDHRVCDAMVYSPSPSPHNDVPLATVDSPLLQREGATQNNFEKTGNPVPTMEGQYCHPPPIAAVVDLILTPARVHCRVDVREAEVAAHEGRGEG